MTITNDIASSLQSDRQANRRSRRDFELAYRHSRTVAMLKRALPAIAVVLTITFFTIAAFSLSPIGNFALDLSAFRDGKLVMNAPKLSGFDARNRPFDLVAARAVQDLDRPGLILLEEIDAKVPMDEGSFADIKAIEGAYQTKQETLKLDKQIFIQGARGMDIALESADIDMKKGILTSDKPISIESKDTRLSADSVLVEDNGKRIVFKDNVKMTISKIPGAEQK